MIDFKNILTIAKKELKTAFDNPTAYVIISVFLLLLEFLFFRNAFLAGEASLRLLFDFFPWLLIIFIPAITMGALAQEKNDGTIELLLTHPIKEYELLAGKFLGKLAFAAITLLFIFPLAYTFSKYGNIDWGVVMGQYLAGTFLCAVLVSLGIFISCLFASQISAMLVTAVAIFFLVIAGFEFVTASLPLSITPIFENLSVLTHFDSMSRGVIDLRDIWYAVCGITIFMSLAYLKLLAQKYGNQKQLYRRFQSGIILLIGIAILTNIVGSSIPGRIDLTSNQAYTLSPATKKTLKELTDVVNISVFVSDKLPVQLQTVVRGTKDILRDYKSLGKGNINITYKDPLANSDAATEAQTLGINPIQFNTIGQTDFQSQSAYLGLAVLFASNHETIPVIQKTSDIEYQLTSFIKKLTIKDKKKIVFTSGQGEKSLGSDFTTLQADLSKQFDVSEKELTDTDSNIPDNTSILVIAGPSEKIGDAAKDNIKKYIDNGGSVFVMVDAVKVEMQSLSATPNANSFADFLKDYGVNVNQDLLYDLRSNQTVQVSGGGGFSLMVPYPFWIKTDPAGTLGAIITDVEGVTLPWSSSIDLDDNKIKELGFTADKILLTSKAGGSMKSPFSLSPSAKLSEDNLDTKTAGISLIKKTEGDKQGGRIVVIADADFLTEQFAQENQQNLGFGSAIFSWLGQEESLAGIKLKQEANRELKFENSSQATFVKYGNLALVVIIPAFYGAYRLSRRRKLRTLKYFK